MTENTLLLPRKYKREFSWIIWKNINKDPIAWLKIFVTLREKLLERSVCMRIGNNEMKYLKALTGVAPAIFAAL